MGPLGEVLKEPLLWGIRQGNDSTLPKGPLGEVTNLILSGGALSPRGI